MSTYSVRPAREGPAIVDSKYPVFYRRWTSNSTKSQNTSRDAVQRQNDQMTRGYLCWRILVFTLFYSDVVLVPHNAYNKKNADMLYFTHYCTYFGSTTPCNNTAARVYLYQHTPDNRLLNMPIGMSIGRNIACRYLLTPSRGMRICRSIPIAWTNRSREIGTIQYQQLCS